jgi:hypothetical protein
VRLRQQTQSGFNGRLLGGSSASPHCLPQQAVINVNSRPHYRFQNVRDRFFNYRTKLAFQ